MKKIFTIVLVVLATLFSCKFEKKEEEKGIAKTYVSFGDKISIDGAITKNKMAETYEKMLVGDTINVKFATKVSEVCQKKGCWIKVPLAGEKESFVKFKDYAFFMPMNSTGSEVILNGKAFKSEVSVDELKHYAKDAGKSEEEIAKITVSKTTYSFLADGVLLATADK